MQKKSISKTKVALITGAGRRVGAEITRVLHEQGMNVILHYNFSEKEAKKLCVALNKKRQNSAAILAADLSVHANLEPLIQQSVKIWGRLDALVNNASIFNKTEIGDVSSLEWDNLLNINLKAPFFLAQAAFPHLAKYQGCIVNIVDIHAQRPMSDYPVYCISKASLQMLTKTLAREFGPDVRVNAVSPGQVMWPEGENQLSSALKQKIIDRIPLQRQGSPNEIAKAVSFLISDATYITGHDLVVDGGRLLFG
jgi:pteridine reductase